MRGGEYSKEGTVLVEIAIYFYAVMSNHSIQKLRLSCESYIKSSHFDYRQWTIEFNNHIHGREVWMNKKIVGSSCEEIVNQN